MKPHIDVLIKLSDEHSSGHHVNEISSSVSWSALRFTTLPVDGVLSTPRQSSSETEIRGVYGPGGGTPWNIGPARAAGHP